MENTTEDIEDTELFDGRLLIITFFPINIVLSVSLNTLALVVISKQVSIPEEAAFVHQIHAVLDLTQSLVSGTWSLTWKISNGNVTICTWINSTLPFFHYVLLFSNMASISWLCINKYVLISRPLRYAMMVSLGRTKKLFFRAFLAISLVCTIYLPIPGLPFAEKYIAECTGNKEFMTSFWLDTFNACLISVPIAIAFVVTTWTNIGLMRIVLKQSRAIAAASSVQCHVTNAITIHRPISVNEGTLACLGYGGVAVEKKQSHPFQRRSAKRFKGVVTVLLLQAAFYVCWIPGVMYFCFKSYLLMDLFDAISACSNWIQPLAYLLSTREARKVISSFRW